MLSELLNPNQLIQQSSPLASAAFHANPFLAGIFTSAGVAGLVALFIYGIRRRRFGD